MCRLALIFLLFSTTIVKAEDWTGFYIGGQTGWGTADAASMQDRMSGGVFGVTGGVNYSLNDNWVIGVEGSYAISNIDVEEVSVVTNGALTVGVDLDDYFTVGPRLGFTHNNSLIYIEGGYLSGSASVFSNLTGTDPADSSFVKEDISLDGIYLGAGVDFKFSDNFIAGIGYKHLSFNDASADNVSINPDADADVVTARAVWLLN